MSKIDSLNGKLVVYDDSTRTYYVDGEPLCLSTQLSSKYGTRHQMCSLRAGYGTSHPGTGRCKFHGGSLGSEVLHIKNGRYAPVLSERLKDQMERYASDPDVLDLTPELVLLRTTLANVLEMYQDVPVNSEEGMFATKWMVDLIERIGNMVERIERINRDHVLTAASAKLVMLKAIDAARMFVPPDRMQEFIEHWRENVVGLVSIR